MRIFPRPRPINSSLPFSLASLFMLILLSSQCLVSTSAQTPTQTPTPTSSPSSPPSLPSPPNPNTSQSISLPFPSPSSSSSYQPTPSPSPFAFSVGRIFWKSSDGPIRGILRRDERFIAGQRSLQDFLSAVELQTLSQLQSGKINATSTSLWPCNSDGRGFKRAWELYTEIRRFPTLDTSCISQYVLTEDKQIRNLNIKNVPTVDAVVVAMRNRSLSVFDNHIRISDVVMGNWSRPDAPFDFIYNDSSLTCLINNAAAVRVGAKWYVRATITNLPRWDNEALLERQSISELLRVNESANEVETPLKLSIYRRPEDNRSHELENDTTTVLDSYNGNAFPSSYMRYYMQEIPGVMDATELAEHSIQQANDALTWSSISLLLLPLGLTLIPLTALSPTTASRAALFAYTVLTDILTAIPLIIKGSELVSIGRQEHTAAALQLSSSVNGSLSEVALSEVWTVQCRPIKDVGTIGAWFVGVGCVFMLIGIGLEFMARAMYYGQRRRRRQKRRRVFYRAKNGRGARKWWCGWCWWRSVEYDEEMVDDRGEHGYGDGEMDYEREMLMTFDWDGHFKKRRSLSLFGHHVLSPNCDEIAPANIIQPNASVSTSPPQSQTQSQGEGRHVSVNVNRTQSECGETEKDKKKRQKQTDPPHTL